MRQHLIACNSLRPAMAAPSLLADFASFASAPTAANSGRSHRTPRGPPRAVAVIQGERVGARQSMITSSQLILMREQSRSVKGLMPAGSRPHVHTLTRTSTLTPVHRRQPRLRFRTAL